MIKVKKRVWWGLGGLLTLAVVCHSKLVYDYAHIPLQTAVVPRPWPQNGQSVAGLAFSPMLASTRSQLLAVVDTQVGFSYWTVPQLRCDKRFESPVGDDIFSMLWTSDGNTLAIGDSEAAGMMEINQGKYVTLAPNPSGYNPKIGSRTYGDGYDYHVVSSSSKLAAKGLATGIYTVWDTGTGRKLFAVPLPPPGNFGCATNFCDLAFSCDDRFVATTSMQGDQCDAIAPVDVVIREARTGLVLRKWQWKQTNISKVDNSSGGNLGDTGLTFSPDGMLLAMANDVQVVVCDIHNGTVQRTLAVPLPSDIGGYGGKKRLVFFDGGRLLAGVGWGAAIPVWDVRTGTLLQTFYGEQYTDALAVSFDSKFLATGGSDGNIDGKIDMWDVSRLLR